MSKRPGPNRKKKAADVLQIEPEDGEGSGTTVARVTLDPVVRHASLAMGYASQVFGKMVQPNIMDSTEALKASVSKAEAGDMQMASRMLASQAVSLDAMFTELARRSGNNMGEYPDAADRYMRLALRAQSNCRTTLEALAKLHQPREQTVRHVHVNEGGQAVVADHFHNHAGGRTNAKSAEQSHATGTLGESAALPSQDPQGIEVPISGDKGKAALSHARRHKSRRA